jgi:hypothetical protein
MIMKHSLQLVGLLLTACLSQPLAAQTFDDTAVCNRLALSYRSGLYIAYPSGSRALMRLEGRALCAPDGSFCATRVNGDNAYEPVSRFYYLPGPKPRTEEGVWHIRTQTEALNLEGADFAFLSRPALKSTRCSPNTPLSAFSGSENFVSLNRYIDYHVGKGQETPTDLGLDNSFHFAIQDSVTPCVKTNDTRVFKDLRALYGFENVRRTEQRVVRWFSASAIADPIQYAGLSSEFAYQDKTEMACFGFAAPIPTMSGVSANNTWKPSRTSIVIKRLKGRHVTQAFQDTIIWRP